MKKRILSAFLAALAAAALSCAAVGAGLAFEQYYGDGFYYVVNSDNTAALTNFRSMYNTAENIAIPAEFDGHKVASIEDNAFAAAPYVKTLVIPDGVKKIGDKAFRGCSSLESVTIPGKVSSIGTEAFKDCKALVFVSLPASVAALGTGAFAGCTSLTGIDVDHASASFASANGVLYDKDVTTLLAFPGAKTAVSIPSSVSASMRFSAAITSPKLKPQPG